jgi:hypothetical protein
MINLYGLHWTPQLIGQMLSLVFFSILFLQAGLDKVLDYKGNLEYFKSHFSKSFLASSVPMMLPVLTLAEIASGALCFAGIVGLWCGSSIIGLLGIAASLKTLILLFFGQRFAKDYAGAASLSAYFAVALLALLFF